MKQQKLLPIQMWMEVPHGQETKKKLIQHYWSNCLNPFLLAFGLSNVLQKTRPTKSSMKGVQNFDSRKVEGEAFQNHPTKCKCNLSIIFILSVSEIKWSYKYIAIIYISSNNNKITLKRYQEQPKQNHSLHDEIINKHEHIKLMKILKQQKPL